MENKKRDRKYHAFLCYNSQDKPVVEAIARWLAHEAQLSVWLDKWNLIPGVVPVLLPGARRPEKESKIPRFLRRLTWVVADCTAETACNSGGIHAAGKACRGIGFCFAYRLPG